MMKSKTIRRVKCPAEEGYILVVVVFLLALMTIAMAVAVPKVAKALQRDRELETMQRGKQYIRAIRLYYRKFGAYPTSVDALVNTNQLRFLRKRYLDPTTGKDDWKPIGIGQNKTPLAMGFFGQPLGLGTTGIASAGIGSSIATSPLSDASSGSDNTNSTAGQASGTNSGSDSASGQTLGVGPIIGFSPASPKQSILVYKKKNHYNEWEFLYSPLTDQMVNANTQTAQPPLQGGAPGMAPQLTPAPSPTTPPTTTPDSVPTSTSTPTQ
jgi:type II secretory pathway pseudopilin PulG